MTDETFERIKEFVKRNAVPAGEVFEKGLSIPVYVSDEVADDEPDLSEGEYAVALRLSPNDFADLGERLKAIRRESR
jgi:hypothetical protein